MILRNWYNMIAAYAMGINSTDTDTFGDGHINVKTDTGTIRSFYLPGKTSTSSGDRSSIFFPNNVYGHSSIFGGVEFGTGTAAVTFDDFCLSNPITSGISIASTVFSTPSYNTTTKKWTNECSFVVTNTGSTSLTITEVGFFSGFFVSSTATSALVYREVLATSFTVAAGESVTYTQNLEFTMPTIS